MFIWVQNFINERVGVSLIGSWTKRNTNENCKIENCKTESLKLTSFHWMNLLCVCVSVYFWPSKYGDHKSNKKSLNLWSKKFKRWYKSLPYKMPRTTMVLFPFSSWIHTLNTQIASKTCNKIESYLDYISRSNSMLSLCIPFTHTHPPSKIYDKNMQNFWDYK